MVWITLRAIVRTRSSPVRRTTDPANSAAAGLGADGTPGPANEETLSVPVGPEPDGSAVALDVTVFRPGGLGQHSEPWSAVLLAHGFGGSKADLVERGRDLASRGYLVLGYSARGFGASGGRIHLNDPAYEIADARALVSLLATRSDVLLDAPGDPHVGVVGASYGGALAIMLGATDPRVDSVVGVVAWNDLADAFFPQFAVVGPQRPMGPAQVDRSPEPGPLKALWASRFFGSALASAGSPGAGAGGGAPPSSGGDAGAVCGRFDATVCRLFLEATATGRPSPELLTMLRAHSPRPARAGQKRGAAQGVGQPIAQRLLVGCGGARQPVVTTVDPPDRQPRHLDRDRSRSRGGLLDAEQRVGHPLDEHGRRAQAGKQRTGAVGAQHRQQLGARSPGHRRLQEQPTHGGVESPAHAARATTRARDSTTTSTGTSTWRTRTGEG